MYHFRGDHVPSFKRTVEVKKGSSHCETGSRDTRREMNVSILHTRKKLGPVIRKGLYSKRSTVSHPSTSLLVVGRFDFLDYLWTPSSATPSPSSRHRHSSTPSSSVSFTINNTKMVHDVYYSPKE